MIPFEAPYRAREAARERIMANESTWLRALDRCSCPRATFGRVYYGIYSCARCGKLTGLRLAALKRRGGLRRKVLQGNDIPKGGPIARAESPTHRRAYETFTSSFQHFGCPTDNRGMNRAKSA